MKWFILGEIFILMSGVRPVVTVVMRRHGMVNVRCNLVWWRFWIILLKYFYEYNFGFIDF